MNITAPAAAARLGISLSRVYALIRSGRLPATKWGRDWMVAESDLKLVKVRRVGYPRGRPRKQTTT